MSSQRLVSRPSRLSATNGKHRNLLSNPRALDSLSAQRITKDVREYWQMSDAELDGPADLSEAARGEDYSAIGIDRS